MSIVIATAPLRISLGGGGTDLPSFYKKHGGYVISGTIDKYVYVVAHPSYEGTYRLKYSEWEETRDPAEIRHPIFRGALTAWEGKPLEIVTIADVPAGTGLGSSGAFTVSLLKALSTLRGEHLTQLDLAHRAYTLEADVLSRGVGKQDQFTAAYGGINSYTFTPGTTSVQRLNVSQETLDRLNANLLAFFTGHTRDSAAVLDDQNRRSVSDDKAMIDNLELTKQYGHTAKRLLEQGDTDAFGALMGEHWQNKKARSPGMTNRRIDDLYSVATSNGALGGKVVGAGGGGYLLTYTTNPEKTRSAMRAKSAEEMVFAFQPNGCTASGS